MLPKFCYNGIYYHEGEAILKSDNKSYRYGDGFFETIKIWNGKIQLEKYHQNRIEKTVKLLGYQFPAHLKTKIIFEQITELCKKNNCLNAARVRLSFSNGDGGLFDGNGKLHYLIEAWPLDKPINELNVNGLIAGIFPSMKKSCDEYANIKSASSLIYALAARYGLQQKWNDSIILNHKENICESSIANIFWIKNGNIYTPPLTEGCVAGVMRAFLIHSIGNINEMTCKQQKLLEADEVFLTNAIKGIRWIQTIDKKHYSATITKTLYEQYIKPLHF